MIESEALKQMIDRLEQASPVGRALRVLVEAQHADLYEHDGREISEQRVLQVIELLAGAVVDLALAPRSER